MLKLRIVVNDHDIYECKEKQPVIIPCNKTHNRIIITNGFHHSRRLVVKHKPGILVYEIGSYLDNTQLLGGVLMVILFFSIYIFSGVFFFMLFANVPILIMLYLFYIKRGSFILVHLLKHSSVN